jgi:hypothetical protein
MTALRHSLRLSGSSRALTLLEMMVAVTLLAMIMVGLLAMFNQTQKALRAVNAQSDIFENARGAIAMLSRDISEMTAFGETNFVNLHFGQSFNSGGFEATLPGSPGNPSITITSRFYEAFWLTRANDEWHGIGYFVENPGNGVGTLYRFATNGRSDRVRGYYDAFVDPVATAPPSGYVHRVSDGVVNFQMNVVYPVADSVSTNFISTNLYTFYENELPAFVDIELGVLEPATLKQMESLLADPSVDPKVVQTFLTNHLGNIHFFRQRVPVRNFNNPYRLNEVP